VLEIERYIGNAVWTIAVEKVGSLEEKRDEEPNGRL
jgi:hypothetical protein